MISDSRTVFLALTAAVVVTISVFNPEQNSVSAFYLSSSASPSVLNTVSPWTSTVSLLPNEMTHTATTAMNEIVSQTKMMESTVSKSIDSIGTILQQSNAAVVVQNLEHAVADNPWHTAAIGIFALGSWFQFFVLRSPIDFSNLKSPFNPGVNTYASHCVI